MRLHLLQGLEQYALGQHLLFRGMLISIACIKAVVDLMLAFESGAATTLRHEHVWPESVLN